MVLLSSPLGVAGLLDFATPALALGFVHRLHIIPGVVTPRDVLALMALADVAGRRGLDVDEFGLPRRGHSSVSLSFDLPCSFHANWVGSGRGNLPVRRSLL